MSFIQRFLLGNRVEDDLQVGLFLKNDGTVWLRNPDGSETQVSGGGGDGLPDWWVVDDTGMTVTVEFPDDPDGDYVGLTVEALGSYDAFTGISVLSGTQSASILGIGGGDLGLAVKDGPGFGARLSQIGPGNAVFAQGNDGDDNPILLANHSNDSRTHDIAQFYKSSGQAMLWGVTKDGLEYKQNNDFTEPDDGDVLPNQILEWFDSAENAIAARFKAQDSAGNAFAGKVATMVPDGSAFQGVAKPTITDANAIQLLAALVTLNLAIDDT